MDAVDTTFLAGATVGAVVLGRRLARSGHFCHERLGPVAERIGTSVADDTASVVEHVPVVGSPSASVVRHGGHLVAKGAGIAVGATDAAA